MSTALIVFIFLTPIFQYLAFKTHKQEIRWLYADYAWLIIASVALFFYGLEADQDEARRIIPVYDEHLLGMAHIAKEEILFSDLFLTFFSNVSVTNESQSIQQQKKEFEILNKRLNIYRSHMKSSDWPNNIEVFHNCKELGAGLTSIEAISRVKNICTTFNRVVASRSERNEILMRTKESKYGGIKIYIYPFLLALALSLRLGKTTADVLRRRARQLGE